VELGSGVLHGLPGSVEVAGVLVDASAAVGEDADVEAAFQGVQDGEADAVVGGQSHDIQFLHPLLAKPGVQSGGTSMGVIEEGAVAVDAGVAAFQEHFGDEFGLESGREFGAGRVLDAVIGPEQLFQTVQPDRLAGAMSRMLAGKAGMSGRMPVFAGHHQIVSGHPAIGAGDDLITLGYGQGAAGQEILLEVDQQEGLHGSVASGKRDS